MSTKKKLIEQANKRLLNESLPPETQWRSDEVVILLMAIFDNEIPDKAIKLFQDKQKEKGVVFPTEPPPPGAFY